MAPASIAMLWPVLISIPPKRARILRGRFLLGCRWARALRGPAARVLRKFLPTKANYATSATLAVPADVRACQEAALLTVCALQWRATRARGSFCTTPASASMNPWSMAAWNMIARPRTGLRLCAMPACNARPKSTWPATWSAGREKLHKRWPATAWAQSNAIELCSVLGFKCYRAPRAARARCAQRQQCADTLRRPGNPSQSLNF